jgi:phosphoglycolate phosphatase
MAIDAILFDKDGTLFEFGATWEAWANAFLMRATGRDVERATRIGHTIGFDVPAQKFHPSSIVIAGTPAEIVDAISSHFPEVSKRDLLDMINEEAETAPQKEAVPLAALLDGLRARGVRLGVATNDAEAPAMAHLRGAGILDRFDFVSGFDSGHGAKPAPGPLLAFCRSVGVVPDRAIMVGDSTHDLIAGRAAGMRTVGVLTGLALAAELAPYADIVLPDIGHLPTWAFGPIPPKPAL